MIDPYYESVPSPHCGRIDEHDEHTWRGVEGEHVCPGPPRGSTPYPPPQ